MELHPRPNSLADILDATRGLFLGAASARALAIGCQFDPDLAPAHHVDAIRLRQVLNNLVGNALKFTSSGEVRLRAEVVRHREDTQVVLFTVEDTGTGISTSDQRRLFQSFAQVDKDPTRAASGTGLGLAICKRLVESMGGSIELRSEIGRGSAFSFALPLRLADARQVQRPDSTAAAGLPPCTGHEGDVRVLVVDDHPVNRLVLERQVQSLGYRVESAGTADEAMAKFESSRFDVVVTDCNMPDADGYELARRIRACEAARRSRCIPIIAYTGDVQAAGKCLAAGMDDYLAKPVSLAQLRQKLAHWSAGNGGPPRGGAFVA